MQTFQYVSSDQIHFHRSLHLRPRTIPYYRFLYYRFLHVESGQGEFRLGRRHLEVGTGWLGLLGPGKRENRYDGTQPVSYRFVEFASERNLMDDAFLEFSHGAPQRTALIAILETIHLERSDPEGCLLAAAVRLLTPEQPSRGPESIDPRLAKVLQWIERRPDRNPTVADLAAVAEVSEPHLRRMFRAQLGTGPKQYLMRIRMEFAKRLLRHEGMRVGQAADLLGFASIYQFSAQFRQVMGHPPSDERRS